MGRGRSFRSARDARFLSVADARRALAAKVAGLGSGQPTHRVPMGGLVLRCTDVAVVPGTVAAEYGKPLSIRQIVSLFLDAMPSPVAAVPRTVCEGYVLGFLQSAGLLEHANRSPPRYCLLVAVSPRAVANLVVEAAKGAPNDDYPAAMVLRAALEDQFPLSL